MTESEQSLTYTDSTFPDLNQIEELINTKFSKLTQDALRDMYDRLIMRVPEILETKFFEKFNESVNNTINQVQEMEQQIKDINIPQLENIINEGKEEIYKTFKELIDDIKNVAPTVGIATQESLATNVKRINNQIQQLTKKCENLQKGLEEVQNKCNQSIKEFEDLRAFKEAQKQTLEKDFKTIQEQFNKVISDCKKQFFENMETINNNVKLVNGRISNLEKKDLKEKVEQVPKQQQNQNSQNQTNQLIREQIKDSLISKTEIEISQTISLFNQGNKKLRFIIIEGKKFLYDSIQNKIINVIEDCNQ